MKILYICTHNRCRSILSEAITNHAASDLIEARSAGSQPVGEVHPLSLRYLQQSGISIDGLQSQSWDDFEDFEADVVVTVCDSAAGETCPIWFGNSIQIHWGLTDPSKLQSSEQDIEAAFKSCIAEISTRVEKLKHIASQGVSKEALKDKLIEIGAEVKGA